jgi:glutamate-1-semialdehyde 2,1-aminomutase
MPINSIEETYRARTRRSAELLARAKRSMPGGLTRNFGYHPPYPVLHALG